MKFFFIENGVDHEISIFGAFLAYGTLEKITFNTKTSKKVHLANLAILNSMSKLVYHSKM